MRRFFADPLNITFEAISRLFAQVHDTLAQPRLIPPVAKKLRNLLVRLQCLAERIPYLDFKSLFIRMVGHLE